MTTKAANLHRNHRNPMDRQSVGDRIISVVTYIVYAFFAFVCAYPFYYIIINSSIYTLFNLLLSYDLPSYTIFTIFLIIAFLWHWP